MHIPRLKPGNRIRHFLVTVDSKSVKTSSPCGIGDQFKPALVVPFESNPL
jgi:hypothetical protein